LEVLAVEDVGLFCGRFVNFSVHLIFFLRFGMLYQQKSDNPGARCSIGICICIPKITILVYFGRPWYGKFGVQREKKFAPLPFWYISWPMMYIPTWYLFIFGYVWQKIDT
jgi:hypothetical protein